MRRISAFAVVLMFPLFAIASFAQNATTSLRGVVKDPSGAVVPGATITLNDSATGQTLKTTSGAGGEYQLLQIPPATYTIVVAAPGFGNQSKTAELLVNQPATIDFALAVNATTEVVNVSEAAQTLNTTDASLGGSADNATIQALPSETRNVPDLLSLQPGVLYLPTISTDSRNGAVNGGRSDQGNVTLDGVDDNDQVNGFAFTGVLRETQDSVEEFRVTTGNANADAGRSSGAQISLVTKAGTNKYHGAAYEYFRPTNTVSNDFFNKQAQMQEGFANRPPKEIRNIFGADVGGPIVKNKLFFFANYEGERIAESAVVAETVPTAAYLAGNLSYQGDNATGLDPATQVLNPAAFAMLDSTICQVCNGANGSPYTGNPGGNPNALAYFAQMPAANGMTEGDGLNTGSYTFASPNPVSENTTIVKFDYVPNSKHRIFGRGNLQKDTTLGVIQFPGQPPSTKTVDNTKGMTFGDTWTINANLVNDIRYGYIRQGNGNYGVGSGDYVDFRFMSSPTAETRTTIASVPVNNIIDNLNWTKGKHNIQFGVNWRLIHQNRHSDALSFNNANSNPFYFADSPPDPSSLNPTPGSFPTAGCNPGTTPACYEPVDGGFGDSYEIAYDNLVGAIPQVTDVSNYELTSATSGTLLGDGAFLDRHFKANEYEGYVQDSWRPQPNLTITFGLRYSNLQTPYETHGQEVTPTIDTDAWYKMRESAALQGQIYEPNLTFAPAGKFYGKPGLYAKSKDNFAPRLAIAYAPNNKTSIRAGAGIYYDHFGQGLINVYDQNASFGLSNSVTNPADSEFIESAPRFLGRNVLPFNNGPVPTQLSYPYTPDGNAATGFAITSGIDNKIKTPYSETFDFSVQRELPGGFTLETNYVGRLGRHLLQSLDLAEPVDFVDTQGGGDYFTAAALLSKATDQNGDNRFATVQSIPYFEDIFPFMANTSTADLFDNNGNLIYNGVGQSATQNIYTDEWARNRAGEGETNSIADIDFFCAYGCPTGYQSKFWQNQFASLYALATVGMSYYNAAQITLHHPVSHGLQFDINYTFSKSIDFGSDAERAGPNGGASAILNTWNPALNRGVSDFDTTHLLTVNYVDQLPFGKGRPFLANAGPVMNALIGGWQLSGIIRFSSGLPFSLAEQGFTTDWDDPSFAVATTNLKAKRSFNSAFDPQYFANANAINGGVLNGTPVRLPYPGEAGERNKYRGDGYFGFDSGLAKSWKMARNGTLKFSWEVYNVTNAVRFDPFSINGALTTAELGVASAELSSPRRMQFSLRYDF
jgi:Carboxypeptidase regulatory-like domain/TonB dependent receptor